MHGYKQVNKEDILDGYDYAAWHCQRHVWPSIDAFLTAPVLADGIHSIDCAGLPLDLLFHGSPLDISGCVVVPVFFSGAVTTRRGTHPPFFSGLGIAKTRRMPAICVADPSLALDCTLGLAWYAGNALQPIQTALAAVLQGLAIRSGRELLLIGGSGGGFAALYYGHVLGSQASVLTWNPQIDWLEYEETAVRHYLAVAYPDLPLPSEKGPAFRLAASNALQSLEVVHSLLPIAEQAGVAVPRRLVYLQNASDWHVARHAAPFMEVVEYSDLGDGFHMSLSREGFIWFGNWGKGHEAAPRDLVEFVLQRMLDFDMPPAALISEISGGEMACYIDAKDAPRDLRQAIFSTTVKATTRRDAPRASTP